MFFWVNDMSVCMVLSRNKNQGSYEHANGMLQDKSLRICARHLAVFVCVNTLAVIS